jgi:hypothetical protein
VLGNRFGRGAHHSGQWDNRERAQYEDGDRRSVEQSRDNRNRNEDQKRVEYFQERRLKTGI